jgi:protein TonB
MRRRRQKNPLLMRILGISILVHIVALPILAHFGAFKKIQREFIETRMVVLPPPPSEKERPEVKKPQRVAHKLAPRVRREATTTHHTQQAAHRSNLNQPKVVASAGSAGSDANGPTVDANGTGAAGQLPTQKADTTPPTVKTDTPPKPQPMPPPKIEAPKIAQNTAPQGEAPPAPKPESPKPPAYTDAVPTNTPQPAIPDDLRADALDKTFVAEFTVGPDGTPTEVQVAQSTGSEELDRIALDTAKQWRFKPATRDGQPIESRVRLHIEFQVS